MGMSSRKNTIILTHLYDFDNKHEGDGQRGDDEHESPEGEEQGADPRPLLANCNTRVDTPP